MIADEVLEACLLLLTRMEQELCRENFSLEFNDAWWNFEKVMEDLQAEVNDG